MSITIYMYHARGRWERLGREQVLGLYDTLRTSPLYGEEPQRYGFVQMHLLGDDIIYGFFAQQYLRTRFDYDDYKQEQTTLEDDFARYLFIYQPNLHRVLLQRRRSNQPGLPPWPTVSDRFRELLRIAIYEAGLNGPQAIVEATEDTPREEFVAIFDNPEVRVIYLSVEDLDANLLPNDFPFFNPRREFNEAYERGIRRTSENAKRIVMEAKDNGDLSQSPDAKGYIHVAREPRAMKYMLRGTSLERFMEDKREIKREFELSVDDVADFPADDVVKILTSFSGPQQRLDRLERPRRDQQQLPLFEQTDTP